MRRLARIWYFFFSGSASTVFTGTGAATLQQLTVDGAGRFTAPVVVGPIPFGIVPPTGERWVPQFGLKFPRLVTLNRAGWGAITMPGMRTQASGKVVAPIPQRVGAGHAALPRMACNGRGELDLTWLEEEELILFV